jgi:hypothetical protein
MEWFWVSEFPLLCSFSDTQDERKISREKNVSPLGRKCGDEPNQLGMI